MAKICMRAEAEPGTEVDSSLPCCGTRASDVAAAASSVALIVSQACSSFVSEQLLLIAPSTFTSSSNCALQIRKLYEASVFV